VSISYFSPSTGCGRSFHNINPTNKATPNRAKFTANPMVGINAWKFVAVSAAFSEVASKVKNNVPPSPAIEPDNATFSPSRLSLLFPRLIHAAAATAATANPTNTAPK
jgi:hypothetical protein